MLEMPWQDTLGEFIVLRRISNCAGEEGYIQDDKTVSHVTPPHDMLICRIFQHPTQSILIPQLLKAHT
jgi:hypothetical protein